MRPPPRPLAILPAAVLILTVTACGDRHRGEPAVPTPEPEREVAADETAKAEPSLEGAEGVEKVEEGELPLEPLTRLEVVLYFPSSEGAFLAEETREIFNTASPVDRAKQVVSDLLQGPNGGDAFPALPAGTRLRQVFVHDRVAYVDFSSELKDTLSGGSITEIMAVYSIVNSLVLNLPEIDRVAILVAGRPCETLSGHVDLRRPLPAEPSLLEW